jgi:hypothetical protein
MPEEVPVFGQKHQNGGPLSLADISARHFL